jgi:hypothetical protein
MISGTLMSSANWIGSRPKLFNEGELLLTFCTFVEVGILIKSYEQIFGVFIFFFVFFMNETAEAEREDERIRHRIFFFLRKELFLAFFVARVSFELE